MNRAADALDDRLLEKTSRLMGRDQLHADAGRAGRLAGYGDVVGIPTKCANIAFDPPQRLPLVLKTQTTVVRRIEGGVCHEPKRPKTIVDRYDDEIARSGEIVKGIDIGRTTDISSTVDPYNDRLTVLHAAHRGVRRGYRDI